MSANRRRTAAAIALTAGITAGAALMLSACGPNGTAGASGPSPKASASGAAPGAGGSNGGSSGAHAGTQTTPATQTTPHTQPAAQPVVAGGGTPKLNGTAHGGLTISDGSRWVVMNGTRVDFGTAVRDLAWSPDGHKAAFVDGDGDLVVSNPDGSHRVVVVKGSAGRVWSHPTWQVRPYDAADRIPGVDNLLFAGRVGGVSRLYSAPATAHDATAQVLGLSQGAGAGVPELPQTNNVWPDAGGSNGTSVYANTMTGDVYIRDDYLRQQGGALTHGSEPALAPTPGDGDVVFVRSVAGHDHLFVETSTAKGPVYEDITPHATTDYTEPAFSPDGRTIAARTPEGIVTLPADGSHAPVKVSDYHGLPAYRA